MVCTPSLDHKQKQQLLNRALVPWQTNNTSNETTLPSKTNRPNKRPNIDERSVNERANKQARTAERDSTYVPEEDPESPDNGDIHEDGSSSPMHGRTRSSVNSLAKLRAQTVSTQPISQSSRNTTSLQTSASDKTASKSPSQAKQTRGTERVMDSAHNNKPVSTTTAMQGISLPKANPGNSPSKASQPERASAQIECLSFGTAHDLFASLVKTIADYRKAYELLSKFPERQGNELNIWSHLDLISNALSYQSAQLLIEKQTRELQELRSENDTHKKGRESLEAELAKKDQQIKSSQSQGCKECRRLQERIAALEKKINHYQHIGRQFLSDSEERQPLLGSPTSAAAISS
ncbi:hypothetical protein COH20_007344 [Aspergillus flavus]|uniref:Uncharacterized protein n=1 Tax=Aspergillus flavus TaxID=5059 RepID=A0AB74BVH3_ASPFL|nr:hypothetical protein COH20_007344 [Aspergillus flavus]RAQ68590.1 hypothetical protein COH21_001654 [Aspergillus flavus]RMZ38478.1 hypothetical protein CA14_007783 [Aspergillus flavus]